MKAALGLGSNLGDRHGHLERALRALGDGVVAVSGFHETEPVGGPPQPAYVNAAAILDTPLAPLDLLHWLQELERNAGRKHRVRWGPRTLDLDILLCDDAVIEVEPDLIVPHPRLAERAFVLVPLAEIAGAWTVPGTGKTVEELLEDLQVDR